MKKKELFQKIKELFQKNMCFDCAVFGAFIGVVAFLLIFGIQTLDVTNDQWILPGYGGVDIIQHYAGS